MDEWDLNSNLHDDNLVALTVQHNIGYKFVFVIEMMKMQDS